MKEIFGDSVWLLFVLSILTAATSLIGTIASALIFVLTAIIIVGKDSFSLFGSKSMTYLLLFYFIVIIYSLFGYGNLSEMSFKTQAFAAILVLVSFIMSSHVQNFKTSQIRIIVWFFVLCIIYSVMGTTYVSLIDPMALREYGFGSLEGAELLTASKYYLYGMMSYGLSHAMSVAAVGLSAIICYAPNKWLKIVSIILLFMIIRVLFVMTITTALLIALLGCSIIFATYFSKGKIWYTFLLVILLFGVFFSSGLVASALDFAEGVNSNIAAKLIDFVTFSQTGSDEGQAGYRQHLYSVSFNTFLHNPIFGGGKDNGSRTVIGEHSYLLDYLAYYGLFALLFFLAWWKDFKSSAKRLSKHLRIPYYFSFIPVICMLALKAQSVCVYMPFFSQVFLQIVFIYLDNEHKKTAKPVITPV